MGAEVADDLQRWQVQRQRFRRNIHSHLKYTVYSSGSEPKVETWQTLCRLFHEDKKAQGPVVAKKQTEQMVGL